MTKLVKRYPVAIYVVCCLAPVHVILWTALAMGAGSDSLKPLKLLFAILPTASAFFLTVLISGEKGAITLLRQSFRKETKIRVYAAGLLVFPVLGVAALGIRYFHDGFYPAPEEWKPWYIVVGASPFLLIIPGIFEEYGWRGFMQRKLQKRMNVIAASALVGLTWGSWHMMDFLMGNWLFETATVGIFFVYIIGVSLIIGFAFDWSGGSIFVAMLTHFSANFVNFFVPLWLIEPGILTPMIFIGLVWALVFVLSAVWYFGGRAAGGVYEQ